MEVFINYNAGLCYESRKNYPQTLLEECKYVQEKIKIENLIDEDLEKSESDSNSNDERETDNDNDE